MTMDILNSITKRATEDTVKIEERTFKLKKVDPLMGNYILMKLLTVALPFGIGDMLKSKIGVGTESIPTAKIGGTAIMGKADFLELQRDILSCCFEALPAGLSPVVRDNGSYGIENFNSNIAIQLLIACIAFNFSDFFVESQS